MSLSEHPSASPYFNPQKAAAYLGVSKSHLDKLRTVGGGPMFSRVGTHIRYHVDDLDAWMRANRFANTSQFALRQAA